MKLLVKKGTKALICHVFAQNTTSVVGAGQTGLANTNVRVCYMRAGAATHVDVDDAGDVNVIPTLGTFAGDATDAALKEVDATDMPGVYELHLPDNALATGSDRVVVTIGDKGSNDFVIAPIEIQLTGLDMNDSIGQAVFGRDMIYVTAGGSNDNDGGSFSLALATGAAAVAAASDGDMLIFGPGTFSGQVDASAKNKLLVRGAGPGQTILTHDTAETFLIGNDFDLQSLSLHNTEVYAGTDAYCLKGTGKANLRLTDVTFDSNDVAISLASMSGEIRLTRCDLEAAQYTTILMGTSINACRFYAVDSTFQVRDWTTCSSIGLMLATCTFELDRCIAIGSLPTGGTHFATGLSAIGANGVVRNCWMRAEIDAGAQQNTHGVEVSAGGSIVVLDSHVSVSGTANSYDFKNSGGTVAVGNTHYDRDKTSGTITMVGSNVVESTAVARQEFADELLKRDVSHVEALDGADGHTICTMVLIGQESTIEGTIMTVLCTDGETQHATKTVTVSDDAKPITGIS